jgi:hypothetical protein
VKPVLDPHQRYWDGYEPVGPPDATVEQEDERIEATQVIPPVKEPVVESVEGVMTADTSSFAVEDEWDYSKPTYADPHLLDAFREETEPIPVVDTSEDSVSADDVVPESSGSARSRHGFGWKPLAVVIVLTAGLCAPFAVHAYRAHGHAEALTACLEAVETERSAYARMSGLTKRHARESGYTADDLADPDLVGRLADLVDAIGMKPEYPQCGTSQSTGVLRSQADDAGREANRFTRLSKRFTRLAGEVDDSHTARLLDDAKDLLQTHIDKAETTLSDSKDRVADETTRAGLKTVLDQAKKMVKGNDVDAMETDAAALDKAIKSVEASVDVKRQADQTERDRRQAQQDAEQSQNETQSGSGSSSTPPYPQPSTPQSGSGSGSASSGSDGWSVPSQGSDPLPDTDSGL